MKFSAIVLLLSLTQYVLSSPTPLSVTSVRIITEYVVVPFPKPFPRNLLVDARSFLGLEDRSLLCKIDAVLLAFKLVAAEASPFCSSYLHLAGSTSVVVTTPLTTITTTTTTSVEQPMTFIKRGIRAPIPTPPGLGKYLAAQISSACSCLSIPVPVVTSTSTAPTDQANVARGTDHHKYIYHDEYYHALFIVICLIEGRVWGA
ncbi:hypothetical protein N431DRAFT_459799 [Stipitochalara longipes BDJ]|nr:hypothetical protein N431DRAFT_459799 [Stipitochalara longipes BDJ]